MKKNYLDQFFQETMNNIIKSERYQLLKNYRQHGITTIYQHNINVAIKSYVFARKYKLKIDYFSLIRGALLHDYYFYDWHNKNKGFRWHGYRHAGTSITNASLEYQLSEIEKDIIFKHMFPLTLFRFPKYKESWIVIMADKIVTIQETCLAIKHFFIHLFSKKKKTEKNNKHDN